MALVNPHPSGAESFSTDVVVESSWDMDHRPEEVVWGKHTPPE